jgi:sugar phosphate isomerase/epimerase
MMLGRYPDELIQIVRGVNRDNLGICLDVAHANTTKTLDKFLNIRDKAEDMEIIHLHASDNFGADDLHLPLGKGNLDWKRVSSGIEDYGYEGRMVMELYTIEDGIASLEFINNLSLR